MRSWLRRIMGGEACSSVHEKSEVKWLHERIDTLDKRVASLCSHLGVYINEWEYKVEKKKEEQGPLA